MIWSINKEPRKGEKRRKKKKGKEMSTWLPFTKLTGKTLRFSGSNILIILDS